MMDRMTETATHRTFALLAALLLTGITACGDPQPLDKDMSADAIL